MRHEGTIVSLVIHRGFGFVRPRGGDRSNDLFFHARDVENLDFDETLQELHITYELAQVRGRDRAVAIRKAQ